MSMYGIEAHICGVPCAMVLRGSANGHYQAVFERERASLEEIEAIETGTADAPKPKKNAAQGKPVKGADKGKKTSKKKDGAEATQGKADTPAPELAKSEQPAALAAWHRMI